MKVAERGSVYAFGRTTVLASLCVLLGCSSAAGPAPAGSAKPVDQDPVEELLKPRRSPPAASATPGERPEDAIRSTSNLVARSQAALNELSRIARRSRVAPDVEALARDLPGRRSELETRVAAAREDVRRSRRSVWLRDVRYAFVEDARRIAQWQAQVDQASTVVQTGRQRTGELLEFWRRADALAKESGVAPEVSRQTSRVVEKALETELLFAPAEATLLPLQVTLAEMHDLAASFASYADRERPRLFGGAPERDFSAAQALARLSQPADVPAALRRTGAHMLQMARLFATASSEALLAHVTFMLLVLLGGVGLRSHARTWQGDDREGPLARRLVAHPLAGALLFGMIASAAFYEAAPTVTLVFAYLTAYAAALVLFPHFLSARLLRAGYVVGAFLLVDTLRLFLVELPALERVVLTLELVAASAVLVWSSSRRRWGASAFGAHAPRLLRGVVRLWAAGAAAGAIAAALGFGRFADVLGGGTLISLYLALIAGAGFEAARATLWILTQDALFGRLNSVRKHRTRVVAAGAHLLRWLTIALWAYWSLRYLTLARSAERVALRLFEAALEVGSLRISVGDVVVLVLGVWLAVTLARLIRSLLEEDVVSRFDFSEGTRQVTTLSAYYVVLVLGFFLALAASGIELGKLTILAGALGVGLGFGLQTVVQNFVAGLLLMFGGTIKPGDKIQLGELMGEVRAIGFSSSTVRTWQGAEVIVPNSKLVADQVINWTLTDQKRRIEIEVPIAHGSDPERVLALLLEVAQAHPRVLAEPQPMSIFLRHGQHSIDFQLLAWVTFDDFNPVRSELTTAIHLRLKAEKILIPLPQRDLNLARIAPEVLEGLRALVEKPR